MLAKKLVVVLFTLAFFVFSSNLTAAPGVSASEVILSRALSSGAIQGELKEIFTKSLTQKILPNALMIGSAGSIMNFWQNDAVSAARGVTFEDLFSKFNIGIPAPAETFVPTVLDQAQIYVLGESLKSLYALKDAGANEGELKAALVGIIDAMYGVRESILSSSIEIPTAFTLSNHLDVEVSPMGITGYQTVTDLIFELLHQEPHKFVNGIFQTKTVEFLNSLIKSIRLDFQKQTAAGLKSEGYNYSQSYNMLFDSTERAIQTLRYFLSNRDNFPRVMEPKEITRIVIRTLGAQLNIAAALGLMTDNEVSSILIQPHVFLSQTSETIVAPYDFINGDGTGY